jgi:hypothetical protein
MAMNSFSNNGTGTLTAVAGTAIRYLIQPNVNGKVRASKMVYTAAATAHTATFLRPLGRTTTTAATDAAGTVINLAADPGVTGNGIAANDLLAIRETDGITRLYTVSSVSSLAITLSSGLTAGVASGGKVWNFGVTGDTNPADGAAHPAFALASGGATTFTDDNGFVGTFVRDDPLLLSVNNLSNAGTLNQFSWGYTIN